MWLVLPKHHHNVHHRGMHDDYYCITTGWMDPLLSTIGFWKHLETLISMTTGAVPRYDDQKNLQAVVGDQRKFR